MTNLSRTTVAVASLLLLSAFAPGVALAATPTPTPTPGGNATPTAECGALGDYESQAAYRECLVNTSTKAQILQIVKQPPDNVTTKQKDRVYAVYPDHADAFKFSTAQEQRITDWMTWDQLGIKPSQANESRRNSAGTIVDARDAQLVLRQPHYVDGEVTQSRDNGTILYSAEGEALLLKPLSFDPDAVVDFGVSPAGELSYDRELGVFEFRPTTSGTYTVFFVVQETRVANGSTRPVTARYAARIRVSDGVDLSHVPAGSLEELRSDAANWTNLVDTFEQTGILDEGETMEGQLEEIIPWAQLRPTEDPLKALTGNFTTIGILLITGIGGILWIALLLGLPSWVVLQVRRRLHLFERTEAEEGTAKDTLAELDFRERRQAPQTTRVQDLYDDEQFAAAMQDAFGPTLGDAAETFLNEHRPRLHIARNLEILGANGWVGVDRSALQPDGGEQLAGPEVELRRESNVPDGLADEQVHDLEDVDPTSDLIDRIDPVAPLDVPVDELDVLPESVVDADDYDLRALAKIYETDMRLFDDEGTYGQYLERHVGFLHEHPALSDGADGVDPEGYVLGRYLKLAQFMQDQFDWPAMGYIRRGIKLARLNYDTAEKTEDLIERIQDRRSNETGAD